MKLRTRLFLAFLLFGFLPVAVLSLLTLELAIDRLERATAPGIERALYQARELVGQTHEEMALRALRVIATESRAGVPEDLLAQGLDFALIARAGDTLIAVSPTWPVPSDTSDGAGIGWPRADQDLLGLARRDEEGRTTGLAVLSGHPAVYGRWQRGERLTLGGYVLPDSQRTLLDELSVSLQRFDQLKLLQRVNRRVVRLVWLAANLIYLAVILGVTRWTARSLTRPLARLGELVETVGPGHWDVRLEYDRRDEIGALVRGFNRMSARLAETTERLIAAEKAAAWQQTARVIAHGIKNILAPVKLALTRLSRTVDPADAERLSPLETIQTELERLEKTARDFSLYGRPVRDPSAPVDLNMAARQAARLCTAQFEKVKLLLQLADPAPCVLADWDMMREVMFNLIKNGCEAAGPDGAVTVTTAREGGQAVVKVSDSGSGIDPGLGERIFEPYVTTRTGGTGLGLAIVKKIVVSAGGTITWETGDGGTRFVVRLPLMGDPTP